LRKRRPLPSRSVGWALKRGRVVHAHQEACYQALRDSTRASDCAVFIEFLLERLFEAIAAVSETPVKTRVKTPVKTDAQLLALLRRQPTLTLADAAAHLGKSVSAVERLVRKLREAGRLRHVGPQKGGHWEVLS